MAEAFSVGIHPDEFWNMTPRELANCFAGARKIATRETQRAVYLAWHIRAFTPRQKGEPALPDLAMILRKMSDSPDMTPRQLRRALVGATKAWGASVRVVPRGSIAADRQRRLGWLR